MPIPQLNAEGFLPSGIHDATVDEIEAVFGQFNRTGRRLHLCRKLREYIGEISAWGHVEEVFVDGSFTSTKPEPGDIDILVVLRAEFDMGAPLVPAEYNVLDKRRVARRFGFDVFAVPAGSQARENWIGYFGTDTKRPELAKGLLRLRL